MGEQKISKNQSDQPKLTELTSVNQFDKYFGQNRFSKMKIDFWLVGSFRPIGDLLLLKKKLNRSRLH